MTTLQYLMEREQNLVDRIDKNFNSRVQMLHQLDELVMSVDVRKELEQKVVDSENYEKALRTELNQVRKSMKNYILDLLRN